MTLFEFHELAEAEGGSVLDPLDRRQTEALCQRVRMVFQDAMAHWTRVCRSETSSRARTGTPRPRRAVLFVSHELSALLRVREVA